MLNIPKQALSRLFHYHKDFTLLPEQRRLIPPKFTHQNHPNNAPHVMHQNIIRSIHVKVTNKTQQKLHFSSREWGSKTASKFHANKLWVAAHDIFHMLRDPVSGKHNSTSFWARHKPAVNSQLSKQTPVYFVQTCCIRLLINFVTGNKAEFLIPCSAHILL
jgi:hypothetical protein